MNIKCIYTCISAGPWDPAICKYNGYWYVWEPVRLLNQRADGPSYQKWETMIWCTYLMEDLCELVDCPEYWEEGKEMIPVTRNNCVSCELAQLRQ